MANTLIRAHSDALIPIVANTVEGTEDLVVNALIAGTDEKFAGVLQNLINGGKNGVQTGEFAKLFLKDSKKVNGKYNLSADNIIPENIKIYLFDNPRSH